MNMYSKAQEEPHLLTAILTVASKDDPDCSSIHSALSDHMQRLVSALVYTGPADVEAVEALLILAEWAPQPYSFMTKVGRGEEDRGAWMQVGLAVRLGYLQGLDQTSRELKRHNGDTKRRRLAWASKMPHLAYRACLTGNSMLYVRPTDLRASWEGFLVAWA